MTAKEFLEGKTLTAVDKVNSIIFNLVVDDLVYGLDIDTSSVQFGTKLTRTKTFSISDDILTVGKIKLDLSTTNMLGANKDSLNAE
jgi:hypothetical protein